jgi:UDP-N-acetylglucosamine 4,6-dehydratase
MKYLITGGTGSLGTHITKRLLDAGHEVYIYSRDEYKQRRMMAKFNNKDLHFFIGDVRDAERTKECFSDMDYIIHAAALKHVPVGEEYPEEAVKTNILGTINVIKASKGVKKVVFISSDKACHPINLYGMTKAIAEKLMIQANQDSDTLFACVRYGNVIGSRGSVIEYIQKENPQSINATDARMTRFWWNLDQAVDFVFLALKNANKGEIYIPKLKSCNVFDMFTWLNPEMKIKVVGMGSGEKLHESMVSKDESIHTKEYKYHFVIEPELFGVTYGKEFEYTSENSEKLSKEEFLKLI